MNKSAPIIDDPKNMMTSELQSNYAQACGGVAKYKMREHLVIYINK